MNYKSRMAPWNVAYSNLDVIKSVKRSNTMRMTPEHYDMLLKKMNAYLDEHPGLNVKEAIESERGRWDIYWAAGGMSGHHGGNPPEFSYLTDNHIDTALKSILRDRVARKGAGIQTTKDLYKAGYRHNVQGSSSTALPPGQRTALDA